MNVDVVVRPGGILEGQPRRRAPATESRTARQEDRIYTADLDEAVERAATRDEHVVVTRGGLPHVAVIWVQELETLEALEDDRDVRALHEAEAEDDGARIPWEDLKADLGR